MGSDSSRSVWLLEVILWTSYDSLSMCACYLSQTEFCRWRWLQCWFFSFVYHHFHRPNKAALRETCLTKAVVSS